MQKLYSEKKEHKIAFSPYTKISLLNNTQIRFYREDRRTLIEITASDLETLQYLVYTLNQGVKKPDLVELLEKLGVANPTEWIGLCRMKGIIE